MKLFNKVTNVFFCVIAAIGLFMPLIGYSTTLTGDSFSLVDIIRMGKDMNLGDTSLLSMLAEYGFKDEAILAVGAFALMLVCLLVLLIISFINVPYAARWIVSGIGFAAYIVAIVSFVRIGNAFVDGVIPTTAITSLIGGEAGESALGTLVGSFVSVNKMGIASGAYVGVVCFGVLFVTNTVFFIFRKRFALADGEDPDKKKKAKKSKRAKKKK
ncbi:MAG: hypothetical protein IKE65_05890 [Clostridia bacterium]|nr:hypothetical protein [Clostridia bacterium]